MPNPDFPAAANRLNRASATAYKADSTPYSTSSRRGLLDCVTLAYRAEVDSHALNGETDGVASRSSRITFAMPTFFSASSIACLPGGLPVLFGFAPELDQWPSRYVKCPVSLAPHVFGRAQNLEEVRPDNRQAAVPPRHLRTIPRSSDENSSAFRSDSRFHQGRGWRCPPDLACPRP